MLEIGLLGGYSAPSGWRARCPGAAALFRWSSDPKHAEVARAQPETRGLAGARGCARRPGARKPAALASERGRKFDLIFIDADKENNPEYLKWALKLSRRGTVIVVDNVARHGTVIEADSTEPDIQGTRRCLEMMAAEPRLSAFAMQTVGAKGLDGFALAVVRR